MLEYLKTIYEEMDKKAGRVELIDHDHLIDTQTGLKFHLYDPANKYKKMHLSKDGKAVAWEADFYKKDMKELDMLTKIKDKLVLVVTDGNRRNLKNIISQPYKPDEKEVSSYG